MARNQEPRTVAVVGAGASGTLTAVRLLQRAERERVPLGVWLIDPAGEAGRGPAYGTDDPRHLLNVPAGGMSAFPEDPGHFVRWLAARGHHPAGPDDFVPRMHFGRYLSDVLDEADRRAALPRLHRLHDRVTDARADASGVTLRLRAHGSLRADAAVLALGVFRPGCSWAPPALRSGDRFIADPWRPGALATVPPAEDVLIVGTGLTMADTALTVARHGRVVHAVSRGGRLPHTHLAPPAGLRTAPPCAPPALSGHDGLAALRRSALRHIGESRRRHGDWRFGVDSLRPLTSSLWQQLSLADRRRFVQEDLRRWETHRHRMAPDTAAALHEALRTGALEVGPGEPADAQPVPEGLRIRLTSGRTLTVGAVINCTGPPSRVRDNDDPLVRSLLARGLAREDPLGMGLDTLTDGRLHSDGSSTAVPLWTLGVLRRGTLLESTAIPEIRHQAHHVATAVLHAVAGS
ncbi:FAD/NAD(P)-binding protein [Streptomyces sp. NPDC048644]|uniref:FAD/NAD(P)-binding protein n=1 Tax=Streptomyces sp. NPDC048644 TaxID=3365582 RepID=UPI00371632FB